MTRKKQIIQAAHEYINSDAVTPENMLLAYGDFINGAKWADAHPQNPWISVEERLPEEDTDNKCYSVEVIGLFSDGSVSKCSCSIEDGIWFIDDITTDKPTHWMPMPELQTTK